MNEKKKIFDVVFIIDDEDILELRFMDMYALTDYFIIFGKEESLEKIKKFSSEMGHRIKTFVLEDTMNFDSEDISYISSSVLTTIGDLYSSFDDLVFLSYSNEIPDIKNLFETDINNKQLRILKNDVYECSFKRKRKFKETGSLLTNFSYLLKNKKNFVSDFFEMKQNLVVEDLTLYNGYKILNYKKTPEVLPSTYFCPILKRNVEYKSVRDLRKFVFILNKSSQEISADHIFNVKFKDSFPEKIDVDINQNEHDIELFIPQTILYGKNLEDFQEQYKHFEIRRILSNFDCQNEDDIEIHYDKKNIKTLKFYEIKNPSF
jgi:hypothetical protein